MARTRPTMLVAAAVSAALFFSSSTSAASECCYSFDSTNEVPGQYKLNMTAAVINPSEDSSLTARVFFPESYRIMGTEKPDNFEGSSSCRPLEDNGDPIPGANAQFGNAAECSTFSRDTAGLWALQFDVLVTAVIDSAAPQQVFLNGVECGFTAGKCSPLEEETTGLIQIGETYIHLAVIIVPAIVLVILLIIFSVWVYKRSHKDPEDPLIAAKRKAKKDKREREGGLFNGILGHYFLGKRPEARPKGESKGPNRTRSLSRNTAIAHSVMGSDEESGEFSPSAKEFHSGMPWQTDKGYNPGSKMAPGHFRNGDRNTQLAPAKDRQSPSLAGDSHSNSMSDEALPAPAYRHPGSPQGHILTAQDQSGTGSQRGSLYERPGTYLASSNPQGRRQSQPHSPSPNQSLDRSRMSGLSPARASPRHSFAAQQARHTAEFAQFNPDMSRASVMSTNQQHQAFLQQQHPHMRLSHHQHQSPHQSQILGGHGYSPVQSPVQMPQNPHHMGGHGRQYSNGVQGSPQMGGQARRGPMGPTLVEQVDQQKMTVKRAVMEAQQRSAQKTHVHQQQHLRRKPPQN